MGKYTDISKTLNSYFNQFCSSYLKNNVPKNAKKPYLTYTVQEGQEFEDNIIQVMIYSDSKSVTEVATIADSIGDNLGEGITINAIGTSFTTMYLRKGTPFAQGMNDDTTGMCIYINIIQKIL